MTIFGWLVLVIVLAGIIMMIVTGIETALREKDKERVEELAEMRFRDMIAHAHVEMKQRIEIIDEMEGRS